MRSERERSGGTHELSEYWKKSVMIFVEPERVMDLVLSFVAILASFQSNSTPRRRKRGEETTNATFPPWLPSFPRCAMSKLKGRPTLSSDQSHEIREAFELFDINKDSKLDYHQLKVAIRALGFDLKKAEVLKLLREFNSSDGLIPFDSFHRISTSLPTAHASY